MRRSALLALLLSGCALEPSPPGPAVVEPLNGPATLAPAPPQTGLASFALSGYADCTVLSSTCDDWSISDAFTLYGTATVAGGVVRIDFDGYPAVEGELADPASELSGVMVFMDSGNPVTCRVDGNVVVREDAVEGVLREALTSDGSVNCESTVQFRLAR